jgi:hypothetical protein
MRPRIFAIAGGAALCGILLPVALAQSIAPDAPAKCRPAVPKTGDVLIAGGADNYRFIAVAEFFDPMTERFSSSCNMTAPRYEPHSLVVVRKQGKTRSHILVLGGETETQVFYSILKTTDSWNPLTGFERGPNMEEGTAYGTLVGLNDGRSLVTVGETNGPNTCCYLASDRAMIYDPAKNKFTLLKKKMISRRSEAAAALISGCSCANEGKVLVAGGIDNGPGGPTLLDSAELFDPATNSFTATGNMHAARYQETATSLSDGTILITGGTDEHGAALNSAEIYDPSTETFAFTGTEMRVARTLHTGIQASP